MRTIRYLALWSAIGILLFPDAQNDRIRVDSAILNQKHRIMYQVLARKQSLLFAIVLALFTSFSFTACDDDDDEDQDVARVQVIHASPDAPGVDILVDNSKVNSAALVFPNNTAYLEVNAGARNIKVNAAGTSTSVINADVTFEKDKNYSVFAINRLASIEPLVLVDDLTAPAAGKAHVRFVHLSPDAPAVDITTTTGSVVFGNRAFKSATAFTPLDAGAYNLQVRVAGTPTVALTLPTITLEAGKIYTVFARGLLAPPAGNTNTLGAQIIVNN